MKALQELNSTKLTLPPLLCVIDPSIAPHLYRDSGGQSTCASFRRNIYVCSAGLEPLFAGELDPESDWDRAAVKLCNRKTNEEIHSEQER